MRPRKLRWWWNWQTRYLEVVVLSGVGVQVPPSAPTYESRRLSWCMQQILLMRDGAVWQLVGLITRRSLVQIQLPLPIQILKKANLYKIGFFLFNIKSLMRNLNCKSQLASILAYFTFFNFKSSTTRYSLSKFRITTCQVFNHNWGSADFLK